MTLPSSASTAVSPGPFPPPERSAQRMSRRMRLWRHVRVSSPTIGYSGGTAAVGLVSGVVLARQLGPELRGEVAAVVAWVAVLTLCGDLGLGFAASYLVSRKRERVQVLWTQTLTFAAFLGSLLALGAIVVLPSHIHIVAVDYRVTALAFSAIPLMMAASHQGYLLLGAGYLTELNRIRFVAAFSYATLVVLLKVFAFRTPNAYIMAFWTGQCLSCIVAAYYCKRRLRVRLQLSSDGLPEMLPYGIKTQLGSLSAQANLRLDQLLMSLWLPAAELGRYVVAVALSAIPGPLFSGLTLVVTNAVLRAPSPKEGARRARRHLAFAALAAAPLIITAAVGAGWLLQLLFGSEFASSLPMARLLLAAALFQGMNQLAGAALGCLGTPGRAASSEAIGVIVTVLLLTVLIPRIGALGAAIASLAAYSVVCLGQLFWLAVAARKPADTVPLS